MEIVNSIMPMSDVEALAANGQKLRVAVTKTSAQGKSAQSTAPNLMCFSTDENSVWFNGKKYGVHVFKDLQRLSTSSSSNDVKKALNVDSPQDLESLISKGLNFVSVDTESTDKNSCPCSVRYAAPNIISITYCSAHSSNILTVHISVLSGSSSGFRVDGIEDPINSIPSVNNTLTSTSASEALSASMGKKLQDEKLAKTDVVNNLTTTDTSKALSAAQGKALNDKFNGNKININFSATSNSTDNATIKGYMGNIDGATLVSKLTYGANLVDSSSEDWVITPQEVSASKVVFVGLKFQSFCIFTKTITVTISGSNYTNMAVITANRYVPSVVNNLTSSDTANVLSAAQGKVLNDKISALGSVYRIKGSKTDISEVLALTDAKVGDAWNVTNAFTFGGKPYPANTNVVCLVATSTSDHDENNWDPIGGTVDLSPYARKSDVEASEEQIWEQLGVVVSKDEIVNNLTSTNTDKPLSAAMGKQLNDGKISRSEIVNNLVTNDSSKPLSAAQGKKLQDEKLSKTDASNTYLTKTSAESTYAKKADGISHYSIGELTALSSNPTQEQLKTALGTPSAFRNAIDAGELILVTGNANVQSQKLATCIIDSGNVIVKYLHPGNNDWIVIAKCVPASSGDNWDNAQFSVRIVKPLDSAGIIIE